MFIDERYNPVDWNIYTFYCGDGDNWPEDNGKVLPSFTRVNDLCQMMAYIEICPAERPNWASSPADTVIGLLLPLLSEKFKMMTMSSPDEVWPSFNKLFGSEIATMMDIN